jgi:hypothetical protein
MWVTLQILPKERGHALLGVIRRLCAPLLALVMHIANNDKVMGKDRTGYLVSSLGWLTAIMSVAAVALFFTF